MRSDYHADLVELQELVHDVRPVHHDVILILRVSNNILLHSWDFIRSCWIAPKDVHGHLLDSVRNASQVDTKWSLDLVNILKLND